MLSLIIYKKNASILFSINSNTYLITLKENVSLV